MTTNNIETKLSLPAVAGAACPWSLFNNPHIALVCARLRHKNLCPGVYPPRRVPSAVSASQPEFNLRFSPFSLFFGFFRGKKNFREPKRLRRILEIFLGPLSPKQPGTAAPLGATPRCVKKACGALLVLARSKGAAASGRRFGFTLPSARSTGRDEMFTRRF